MTLAGFLSWFTRLIAALGVAAIAAVLFVVGTLIADAVSRQAVLEQYIPVAASILSTRDDRVDPAIREWAVRVFDENSPTPFNTETRELLENGGIALLPPPQEPSEFDEFDGFSIALAPDAERVFTSLPSGLILQNDVRTGSVQEVFPGHIDRVTALTLSGTGETLFAASLDRTVRSWKIDEGTELGVFRYDEVVVGIAVLPGDLELILRFQSGTTFRVDAETGEILDQVLLAR